MTRSRASRLRAAPVAALLYGLSAPASAQKGAMRGMVVDDGKPVPDAEVMLDYVGDLKRQFKCDRQERRMDSRRHARRRRRHLDDHRDEGRPGRPYQNIVFGNIPGVPEITLLSRALAAAANQPMSAKKPKGEQESGRAREDCSTKRKPRPKPATSTRRSPSCRASPTSPKCTACYIRLGDVYVKKKDLRARRRRRTSRPSRSIRSCAGPYNALATIYNEQKPLRGRGEDERQGR